MFENGNENMYTSVNDLIDPQQLESLKLELF
jgi:hypothetical protein